MEQDFLPSYTTSQFVPPSYEPHQQHEVQDNAIVGPTIFVLAGQSIHAKTPDSPPVYELSRSVAILTKATEKVEFERLDLTVHGTSAEGVIAPVIRYRRRHLYDLRRTVKKPRIGLSRSRANSDAPEYYIHSLSRRTLGHVGLSKFSHGGFPAGFSAVAVQVKGSQVRLVNRDKPLFRLQRSEHRSHWVSVESEDVLAIEDAADNQKRLIFMKPMPRKEVDALVALWCCRIWQSAAARAEVARREAGGSKLLCSVSVVEKYTDTLQALS